MATEQITNPPPERLEWDPVAPVKRKRLQVCFQHSQKLTAGDKPDYDYANDMLTQCVVQDPGNLVYVQAFLDNLQRKFKNNKRGGGGFGGRGPLKKAINGQQWGEILKLGPAVLRSNPWDVPTLRAMAEACAVYAFHEVELRYLKNAMDANPKDVEVTKHCARSLARVGQFDQAMALWRRVGEIRKSDNEPDRMISALTLEKTRALSGMGEEEESGGRSGAVKERVAEPEATSSPQSGTQENDDAPRRKITLSARQLLERAISEDPADIDNYLKLADLLTKQQKHGEAEQTLTRALEASGGDLKIREKLEDAQIRNARVHAAIAEKRAAAEQTDEARELAQQMRDGLNRRELEIFAKRAEMRPDDKAIRHELGVRLKRAGNFAEAEKCFLDAREDARLKPLSTLELGECRQQQHQYQLALQCYTRAVELSADGDENLRKLALYRAGTLSMGLKRLEDAERFLSELAKLDAGYRDVKSRLDKIAESRHKK